MTSMPGLSPPVSATPEQRQAAAVDLLVEASRSLATTRLALNSLLVAARREGLTYERIGQILGVSWQTARRMCVKAGAPVQEGSRGA